MSDMLVNSLLVAKEKYSLLNNTVIAVVTTSKSKVPAKLDTFSSIENIHNEFVIKKMIVVLEETVKVLEKKVKDLEKGQKEVKNSI